MSDPVIVSATRTAIGTAFKGTLINTTPEDLATFILKETLRRSNINPELIDDVIFAESMYGGGDLARYAAVVAGLLDVPGQAVNRHCAGSLTTIGNAAAGV
jgi:acetyl-CoA acetyltransferase